MKTRLWLLSLVCLGLGGLVPLPQSAGGQTLFGNQWKPQADLDQTEFNIDDGWVLTATSDSTEEVESDPLPGESFFKNDGRIANTDAKGPGVAWGDYDGDGFLDLIVARGGDEIAFPNSLYHNNGNGTFNKITGGVVATDIEESQGAIWGDYDNDGRLDLFVNNVRGPNSLYHNEGNGVFSKVNRAPFTTDSGYCPGAAWGDYDNDGFIDLLVANAQSGMWMYHNNRDGSFTRVTAGDLTSDGTTPYACAWADYDSDGWLDVVVVRNLRMPPISLYHNNRNGTFSRLTSGPIAEDPGARPLCPLWADYDNDGDLDLLVTNGDIQDVALFRNDGKGNFVRASNAVIPTPSSPARGGGFEDFDNDGYLDLFVAYNNFLFRNLGNGAFETVKGVHPVLENNHAFGASWGDFDNDGYPDLAIGDFSEPTSIYRNHGGTNHWLKVRLVGTRSNRSGIGAKIFVTAEIQGTERTLLRQVSSGGLYGSPNSLWPSFGLGNAPKVLRLRVEWPSGSVSEETDLRPNQFLTITEAGMPPTIEGTEPTAGRVGSKVVISGTGFSPEASKNIVRFGAVRGQVLSASTNRLEARVPVGATYAPVTVTVSGLTAYSDTPFGILFDSDRFVDEDAFGKEFSVGSESPARVVAADFDEDGKTDLAVCESAANRLSIFRSLAIPGDLGPGAFAASTQLATGPQSQVIAAGDLDGDGRMDLVAGVVNGISIALNRSMPGQLTFAPMQGFVTSGTPTELIIRDFDGDGRLDIISASKTSGLVEIFRQTAFTQDQIHLADPFGVSGVNRPNRLAIADFDQDGLPDVAYTDEEGDTIAIIGNHCAPGRIAFSVDRRFVAGSHASALVAGDLDGDGHPDLMVGNSGDNAGFGQEVSAYLNHSVPGRFDFGPKLDFTSDRQPSDLALGDLDGDGKPDAAIGATGRGVSVLQNKSLPESIGFGANTKVDRVGSISSIVVADLDMDGRPDLATTSRGGNSLTVYRNKGLDRIARITVTPMVGEIGSKVTIVGSGFPTGFSSDIWRNLVKFGGVPATNIEFVTSTTLRVVVPDGTTNAPVCVSVQAQRACTAGEFMVPCPPNRCPTRLILLPSPGGGFIEPHPYRETYNCQEIVTLKAIPAEGWKFLQWLGDAAGTSALVQIRMDRTRCVQALFGTDDIQTPDAPGGVIKRFPESDIYPYDAEVRFAAISEPGWFFKGWTGALTGTNNGARLIIKTATNTIEAQFERLNPGEYALAYGADSSGSVQISPRGNKFASGSMVSLRAVASENEVFMGWYGDTNDSQGVEISGSRITLKMDRSRKIFARIVPRPRLEFVTCPGARRIYVSPEGSTLTNHGIFRPPFRSIEPWQPQVYGDVVVIPPDDGGLTSAPWSSGPQPEGSNMMDSAQIRVTGEFGGWYRIDGAVNVVSGLEVLPLGRKVVERGEPKWVPLGFVRTLYGTAEFIDPIPGNSPRRFYRAVMGTNLPSPSVQLTTPASNSVFSAHAGISLSASVQDAEERILGVEFYADGEKIGERRAAPYEMVWTGAPSGCHAVLARAINAIGQTASSTPVSIRVEDSAADCAIALLAKYLHLSPCDVTVRRITPQTWSNTCLDCPTPGQADCIQRPTSGNRIVVRAGNTDYIVHTGGGRAILCDPIELAPLAIQACP